MRPIFSVKNCQIKSLVGSIFLHIKKKKFFIWIKFFKIFFSHRVSEKDIEFIIYTSSVLEMKHKKIGILLNGQR